LGGEENAKLAKEFVELKLVQNAVLICVETLKHNELAERLKLAGKGAINLRGRRL